MALNYHTLSYIITLSLFQRLRLCLQTSDPSQHCLSRDDLSDTNTPLDITDTVINKLHAWWMRVVEGAGPDEAMSNEAYEDLVARLGGFVVVEQNIF
jgi:hypothetical protein